MYWHYQQTMTLAEEIGFRLISGPPITSLGDQDVEEMFHAVRDNFAWQKELDFVYPVLQTHSAYTTTSEMMTRVQSLKEDYGLCFTTHASENQAEVDSVQAKHHRSPIQVLHHHHLLDEYTILVHCVQVDEGELELLSETGSSVAHCPESNLKLGSGIAPIAAMLEKNINLCVGTDGAASNNDLNILGEIKTAAMLQKGVTRHPEIFTTTQALEMITLNSARAYHLDELIGSLEPGKKADLVLIDLEQAHLVPVHDPIANLIYAADRSDVDTVIIDGKIQLQDGRLTRLDEEKIKTDVRSTQALFQP
jgi:5-methylthioadenosine/S-adenosylhomocysteine deaminase